MSGKVKEDPRTVNHRKSRSRNVVFAAGLLFAGQAALLADAIFNFDSDLVGKPTTFSDTSNGVTATFSSPADPGGFGVSPTFFSPPMNGNVLLDPGSSGATGIALDILFSQNSNSISLDFATDGTGTFFLDAFKGTTLVGSVSASGVVLSSFPQGSISFNGATFDNVVLTSPDTPFFAIDNVDVASVSGVPEPASVYLLGAALLALFSMAKLPRRRRSRA